MVTNKELMENLKGELKSFASNPDNMYKRWEVVRKQFYNYSLMNLCVANAQLYGMKNECIEQLASYRKWQKLGRQVRKGEKGLRILAPIIKKNEFDEEELVGFRQTVVFDISQTDGEEYFYSDDDKDGEFEITLRDVVENSILPVKFDLNTEMKRGETDYSNIRVSNKLSDDDKICVIFHELAHNLLKHNERDISRSLKEMEAESVAYITARYFGIDNKGSVRYIHNWNLDNVDDFSLDSANRIVSVSNEIVSMVSG